MPKRPFFERIYWQMVRGQRSSCSRATFSPARINASAVDAYTLANSLFQSLRLTPIQAGFEHLVLSFADVAYQYQANTAEYCDKTHAAYYGRAGSPARKGGSSAPIRWATLWPIQPTLRAGTSTEDHDDVRARRVRQSRGGIRIGWNAARAALHNLLFELGPSGEHADDHGFEWQSGGAA
jgi:hypothetical protein